MRIRSTKPEFWRSKTIAALDWDVRLVLKGLESYVDDNGVGKDDIALIAADVFPRDLSSNPRETLARLSEAISVLTAAGLIVRYRIDGEDLLYIDKWKDIQRIDKPGKGRFPRPDGTFEYSDTVNRDSYRKSRDTLASPPVTLAPGTGEQGNRGAGEQDDDGPPEPLFDPDSEPRDVVVNDAPTHVDNPAKPQPPRPTDSAKTVVRQVLGAAGYPRTILDRLAVQVGRLFREGHPDELIRKALVEWDQRPAGTKPEFLPTILGDLVKASRAGTTITGRPPSKLRATAQLAQELRAEENALLATATKELQ